MIISDQMKALLTYLAKTEGVLIHRLDGEKRYYFYMGSIDIKILKQIYLN